MKPIKIIKFDFAFIDNDNIICIRKKLCENCGDNLKLEDGIINIYDSFIEIIAYPSVFKYEAVEVRHGVGRHIPIYKGKGDLKNIIMNKYQIHDYDTK
jgi:hypothetical protein